MRKSFYYHYLYAFSTSDFLEKHRNFKKKQNFTKKDKVATPQKHSFCTIGVWKRGVCKFRLDFNSRESKSMFFLRNTRECRRCIIICMHLANPRKSWNCQKTEILQKKEVVTPQKHSFGSIGVWKVRVPKSFCFLVEIHVFFFLKHANFVLLSLFACI